MEIARTPKNSIKFLSTPSARRATAAGLHRDAVVAISIHALREEGDAEMEDALCEQDMISIHALREEGDAHTTLVLSILGAISIHALREEGDILKNPLACPRSYFYPRPPRGGRHNYLLKGVTNHDFYPRPPRGGRP